MSVDPDRPPHGRPILPERLPPETMADRRRRLRARTVVAIIQPAPSRHRHAHPREIRARHQHPRHHDRPPFDRNVRLPEEGEGKDVRRPGRRLAKRGVGWVGVIRAQCPPGDGMPGAAGVDLHRPLHVLGGPVRNDELGGIKDGKRPDEDGLRERQHGGGDADAERKRQGRHRREARRPDEQPDAVLGLCPTHPCTASPRRP